MTDDMMALMALVEKTDDVELLRELLAYGLNRLMGDCRDFRAVGMD